MMMRKQMQQRRAGFTLIELLIVVVIIGILAAIALPRLASTREGAYFSTLQSDLRNLSNAMEVYYSANDFTYTGVSGNGSELTDAGYWSASGPPVTVTIATSASGQGWNAFAEHDAIADKATRRCAIFVGDAPPVAPAVAGQDGTVVCERNQP